FISRTSNIEPKTSRWQVFSTIDRSPRPLRELGPSGPWVTAMVRNSGRLSSMRSTRPATTTLSASKTKTRSKTPSKVSPTRHNSSHRSCAENQIPSTRTSTTMTTTSKNTRRVTRTVAALVAIAAVAACSSTGGKPRTTATGAGAGHADTPRATVAMITHEQPGDSFWDLIRKGAQAAADKDNIELRYSNKNV